jgi:hypothetical protein
VVSQEKLLFGVLVDGKQTENPVIDLGDVYYDQVYRDHSFIILNQSDMALDFLVSTTATMFEVFASCGLTLTRLFPCVCVCVCVKTAHGRHGSGGQHRSGLLALADDAQDLQRAQHRSPTIRPRLCPFPGALRHLFIAWLFSGVIGV